MAMHGGQTDHRGARPHRPGLPNDPRERPTGLLTSDPLQGRMSLENGDAVAIEWVASELKKAGLKPAFGDSYVQPVPIVEYRADAARSSIVLRRGGGEQKFAWVDISGGLKRSVDLTAPVVFAAFGVSTPELVYDDYAGIDLKGKIAIVFDDEPRETNPRSVFNGTGKTRQATNQVKALTAQSRGAVALLLVPEPQAVPACRAPHREGSTIPIQAREALPTRGRRHPRAHAFADPGFPCLHRQFLLKRPIRTFLDDFPEKLPLDFFSTTKFGAVVEVPDVCYPKLAVRQNPNEPFYVCVMADDF